MPDTVRRRLETGEGRSRGRLHGMAAVGIGLIPFCTGTYLILLAVGVICPLGESFVETWRWPVAIQGLVLVLAGVGPIVYGLWGILDLLRRRQSQRGHLNEPWHIDHPWDRSGSTDEVFQKALGPLLFTGFMAAFLVPFICGPFLFTDALAIATAIAVICSIPIAALIGYSVYLMMRYFKYGTTTLRFRRFPFFLGETLDVELIASYGIGAFDSLGITLRCIQEEVQTITRLIYKRVLVNHYQVYADTIRFDRAGVYEAGSSPVPISFPLPANGPTTRLSARSPTYWQIEIKADTPGVDYKAVFLVPVYARNSDRIERLPGTLVVDL